MKTLDKKANEFFFMGFREKFLLEKADATDDEINLAFQRFSRTDGLFALKLRIVKLFVALGISIEVILPGAALAWVAIYLGLDRIIFG